MGLIRYYPTCVTSELENLLGRDLLELGLPLHSGAVHPSVTALTFHPLPPAAGGPRGHSSPPGASMFPSLGLP